MSRRAFDKIKAGLEDAIAIARGEADPATYRVHVPAEVDVKAIRRKLGMSQAAVRAELRLRARRGAELGAGPASARGRGARLSQGHRARARRGAACARGLISARCDAAGTRLCRAALAARDRQVTRWQDAIVNSPPRGVRPSAWRRYCSRSCSLPARRPSSGQGSRPPAGASCRTRTSRRTPSAPGPMARSRWSRGTASRPCSSRSRSISTSARS